jgi:hypothetical protein
MPLEGCPLTPLARCHRMPAGCAREHPRPKRLGNLEPGCILLFACNGLSRFCMCEGFAKMRCHLPSRLRKNLACETRPAGLFHRRRTVSCRIQRAAFRGNLEAGSDWPNPAITAKGMKQDQTTPHFNAGLWRGVFASCVSFAGHYPPNGKPGVQRDADT